MAMRLRVPVVGVLAILVAWSASVQTEPTRTLVSVPLFVTDLKGQSIPNLKAPEVEIAEGGATRKASSIVFRGGSRRRVAFFLDEYHVTPGFITERTRASIARFVERNMRTDDAVIVMKPLDPRSATAPLPNIDAVHLAVSAFDGRRGVFGPRGEFEAQYMSTAPESAARQRAQVVRAGLENLALALRDGSESAAQALVIVTEGFKSIESLRMRTTTLRSVARAARLANAPIYILDPSPGAAESPLNDSWREMSTQTGGMLFPGGTDLDSALARIAADLSGQYLLEFQGAGKEDGRFHDIEVKVKRNGALVRAPSGYWAPFGPSRFPPMSPRRAYANLLTPHVSGLIQPWFRMAPAADGRTRVTFSWAPRPGRKVPAERVQFSALTFEGDTVHASSVGPLGAAGDDPGQTTFVAPPGPLQISLAISASKLLDTDVRYIDVPKLDSAKPYIAAVDFVRPRSLPEFREMRADPAVMPTEVREFLRQDRLLVRVRAFASTGTPQVTVTLRNRLGHVLMELPHLEAVDGAAQFELPFARFPRGEYRLHVRAVTGSEAVSTLVTIRVIG